MAARQISIGVLSAIIILLASSCSYRMGYTQRSLPGGYRQVSIPVFSNLTGEVGIETYFTNAIISEFERSQVADVVDKSLAPITVEGIIEQVRYRDGVRVKGGGKNSEIAELPDNSVLATEYRIEVTARIRVRRVSNQKVVWEGTVSSERVYQAPQIGVPILNSANALYNESARQQNISLLATDMMEEAHDRMTENF